MPTLTGFGGLEEIGGNAFLLEDGGSRLLLDIGKRFGGAKDDPAHPRRAGWGDYWDEFLRPRSFRLLPDLLALDLLPPLPSLYRTDVGGVQGPAPVDAVVVSHAHMDHAGLLGLVRPDVSVHASLETQATLASVQATGLSSAETDFVSTRARGNFGRNKDGSVSKASKVVMGPVRRFEASTRCDVGAWRVEHHAVDHSIHGARGTIVAGRGLSLAYTGDFRLHGRNGHVSERFVERAQGVDFLLTEGTRVRRPGDEDRDPSHTDNEVEVEAEIESLVARESARSDRTGFVSVGYPPRDLDRFVSVWNVARRAGRRLAVPTKLAHLLEQLRAAGREDLPDPRADPTLAVHIRPKNKGTLLRSDRRVTVAREDLSLEEVALDEDAYRELLLNDYESWEEPYVTCPNAVTSADVGREPNAYILSLTYWTITDLFDCFPRGAEANGLYVHSVTQPFNDEMEINDRKLDRWLQLFRLDRADTHVSGHLNAEDLEWVIDKVGARVLVPVHSVGASYTAERYTARTGRRAVLPQAGRPVEL